MTLYELTAEYQTLYDLLAHGEIDEQTVFDTIEGGLLDQQLEDKADGYAKIIKMLEADAAFAKEEADRLRARRDAFERNAARLKDRLYDAMKTTGREKFKTGLFSFGIQNNPPKVVVDDMEAFDADSPWWKPRKYDESELDKTAIKNALKDGAVIDGVRLVQTDGLRIR